MVFISRRQGGSGIWRAACAGVLAWAGLNSAEAILNNETSPTAVYKSVRSSCLGGTRCGYGFAGKHIADLCSCLTATRPPCADNRLYHLATRARNARLHLLRSLPKSGSGSIHLRQLWQFGLVWRWIFRTQDCAYAASMSVQRCGPPLLLPRRAASGLRKRAWRDHGQQLQNCQDGGKLWRGRE